MPKELRTQFAQVFIHFFTNRSRSTAKLFVSEPTKSLETKLGRIFGIIEINTPSKENSKIINQVFAELESTYYSFADEKISPAIAFEKTLQKVNTNFLQIISDNTSSLVGNLNEHTMREKINLVVGVVQEKNVIATGLNTIGAYLLHKTNQNYKLIPIISEEDAKPSENTQLFNNIVSGQIEVNDYLFFCNNDFLNFISKERLTKTITSLPPNKAADYFKNSLLPHEGFNFAGIIIDLKEPEITASGVPQSLSSVYSLNAKESDTEKLLSPSIIPSFKELLGSIKEKMRKEEVESLPQENETYMTETYEDVEIESTTTGISEIHTDTTIVKQPKVSKNHVAEFKKKLQLNLFFQSFKSRLTVVSNRISLYFRKIPSTSKIIFVVFLITGGLFAYSITFLQNHEFSFGGNAEISESIKAIQTTLDDAESKLIFGDNEEAKRLLALVETDISNVVVESNQDQEQMKVVTDRLNGLVAKLRKITLIQDPTLLHTIEVIGSEVPTINALSVNENDLYIFDASKGKITKLNTRNREVTEVSGSPAGNIITSNVVDGNVFFVTDQNNFYSIENDTIRNVPVALNAEDQVTDFTFYNDRLYNVIPSRNQIYRHAPVGTGYGSGLTWIQESGINLENVIGIGIDTRIWLASKSGEIMKFFKGFKQAYAIQGLEPELEGIDGMIKPNDSEYIYILENKNNRVVVLDDEGNVVTQYFSPSLDKVTAFEIDEKGKALYIANSNEVYAIIMNHF